MTATQALTEKQIQQLDRFFEDFPRERVKRRQILANYTTFRVGGEGDYVFLPRQIDEVTQVVNFCRANGIPITVLGSGSNVLIADKGIRGVVIILGGQLQNIRLEDNVVIADAGAKLCAVAAFAAKHCLTGLEFAAGIPGSVGGAVLMNAGAYEGQIDQVLLRSEFLDEDGEKKMLDAAEHEFGYRESYFKHHPTVILRAYFKLEPGNRREIYDRINEIQVKRRHSQPLELASAGSAFKRPTGYYAGKLISDAGLKGWRKKSAGVSEKHAGFIVQYGDATAGEVREVFDHVREKVNADFGVMLEPEVRMIGEWEDA